MARLGHEMQALTWKLLGGTALVVGLAAGLARLP